MRVGIRLAFQPGASGGVEQYCHGLARGLARLSDGDQYLLAGHGEHRPAFASAGAARLDFLPLGATGTRANRWRLVRQRVLSTRAGTAFVSTVRRARPTAVPSISPVLAAACDVVHFPTQWYERSNLPALYQPWDLQHRLLPELFTREEIARRDLVYGTGCRESAFVVTTSHAVKRDVVDAYGVDPAKVAVVRPGVPLAPLTRPLTDRRAEPYALFPAQAWPHKNHIRLVEAIASLARAGTTVRVVCPGQPNPHERIVRARARALGIERLFVWPGFVPEAELTELLARARCLVFPSLCEGFGFPVLEALAAGVPVACSDASSLPELVGDAAVLFDPLDAEAIAEGLLRVWSDDTLRARLVVRGRAVAAAHTWDGLAQSCRALYRAAAGAELAPEDRALLAAAEVAP